MAWSDWKPRRSTADLDEMAEDSVDLGRVCYDGENPHAVSTARAAQGVYLVDLCEQPCLRSTGLLGGHGLIGPVLVGLAEAEGGLLRVLQLPSLWSKGQ